MGSAGVIAEVVGSAVEGGGGAGAAGTTSATDEGDGSWVSLRPAEEKTAASTRLRAAVLCMLSVAGAVHGAVLL